MLHPVLNCSNPQSGQILIEYSVSKFIDQPDALSSTEMQQSSEWLNFDWILSDWVQISGWCSIQYWNATIIRVAKSWLNTKWVSAKISLMLYPVPECSNPQSGQSWLNTKWVSAKISLMFYPVPKCSNHQSGQFWLNTKWVSAKISLILYPVLEYSNHQSGQVLIEYSVSKFIDQPDALSSMDM
jgi:predicted RNA-binding protein YlqC (UPF0109 family)